MQRARQFLNIIVEQRILDTCLLLLYVCNHFVAANGHNNIYILHDAVLDSEECWSMADVCGYYQLTAMAWLAAGEYCTHHIVNMH